MNQSYLKYKINELADLLKEGWGEEEGPYPVEIEEQLEVLNDILTEVTERRL